MDPRVHQLQGKAERVKPAERLALLQECYRLVDRWQPRIQQVTNARDRKMLEVILGASLEHAHFFAEALAGDTELLGRSTTGAGQRGTVIADRWLESWPVDGRNQALTWFGCQPQALSCTCARYGVGRPKA